MAAAVHRADSRNWFIPNAAMFQNGHVVITFYVGKDGRITELKVLRPSDVERVQQFVVQRAGGLESRRIRCRLSIRTTARSSPSRSSINENPAVMIHPTRTQQIGLLLMLAALVALALARALAAPLMSRPRVVAIVGPTATGKSALGIALAHRFNGEVVSCDSTAVYRRFDIGTDKVPVAGRQGIPHHLDRCRRSDGRVLCRALCS